MNFAQSVLVKSGLKKSQIRCGKRKSETSTLNIYSSSRVVLPDAGEPQEDGILDKPISTNPNSSRT